jgi:hypothetical protein
MLSVYEEQVFEEMTDALNTVMENPNYELDMRDVSSITIRSALILKAFFDEFLLVHERKPYFHGPRDKKTRVILNYLSIGHYQDVKHRHYRDVECWQIVSWDQTQNDIEFAKLLHDEIIPKCWRGSHTISEHSSTIATSVAEALLNCKEHAYTGAKEFSRFKRWYLGVGEYPGTSRFAFCIYDKGIGIQARLKAKPDGWFDNIADVGRSDSKMIELATKGRSGALKNSEGRGEGLKVAIELLSSNNGEMDIYSNRGCFSTDDNESGKDRRPSLEGTLVSFSFPIEYSKDNV